MYSNILVPVALDEEGAEKRALAVARRLLAPQGRITLLHVAEAPPSYLDMNVIEDIVRSNRAAAAESLREMAEREGVEGKVARGHAGRDIVDFADRHEVDCIVMASHRPVFSDHLLGSTAARVVRHASCSVHVIR